MKRPDWKALLDGTARHAVQFLASLPERPVAARSDAPTLLARLARPVPEQPSPPAEVVEQLVRDLDPGITAMPSGRFFGWVIGGGLPSAVAADWLTTVWDQNAGSAEGTPAAAVVEQIALGWVLDLLDLPRGSSGALVTGTQMAHVVSLAAARQRTLAAFGWDVEADGLCGAPKLTVVAGAERHDTLDKALRLVGLGVRGTRVIGVDRQGRMDPEALGAILDGLQGPTVICVQVGNVNGGAVDPLAAIADHVDRLRARLGGGAVWLHVDGAFGLWARASRTQRALVTGLERADSWATDAHKWLNTPYDCGLALIADPIAHRRAMAIHASYLPQVDPAGVRFPFEHTPELSRRARGFALYAALCELGRSGVADLVDRACALTRRFADRLRGHEGIELMEEPCLNQLVVRFRAPLGGDDDAHTRAVIVRVQREGTCFASSTSWRGLAALRISVCNWSTDEDDVDRGAAAMVAAHQQR